MTLTDSNHNMPSITYLQDFVLFKHQHVSVSRKTRVFL